MDRNSKKAWLYLLPSLILLGAFLIYPLIDVLVYSAEECYNFASQTYFGTGFYNFSYVLHDPYFLQAVKNTFILVIITVPLSTGLALLISVGLSSIRPLRDLFQTIYFLPYVTNTLAVGLVFMILFQKTEYTDGLVNLMLGWFGAGPVDFIDGPYWAKMFVLCFYTIWIVMPFKILVLTSALASVNQDYYKAARVDGANNLQVFRYVVLPSMKTIILLILVLGTIGNLQHFDLPWTMTQGGPARATTTLSIDVYTTAFDNWNIGKAATIGTIWAVLLGFFSFVYLKQVKDSD